MKKVILPEIPVDVLNLLNITEDKIVHIKNVLEHSYDSNVIRSLKKEKDYLISLLPILLKELRQ